MSSRKDKNGRVLKTGENYNEKRDLYTYTYTDYFGKRRYVYSKDLISLRKKENEIIKDKLDGINRFSAEQIDINQMYDLYMSTKVNLRDTTRSLYNDTYNRYVRDSFGKKKIASVKYTDVLVFYSYLLTEKNLHISTIKNIQRLIRPTLELAMRDDLIRTNPADGVIKMLNKQNMKEATIRHALTLEQQREFLQYLKVNPLYDRWYPFFVFMFGTGCRIGEVVGLRWEDVDLETKSISINHSVFYLAKRDKNSKTEWTVNLPKTESGIRIIPMIPEVHEALLEEKKRQEILGERCNTVVCGLKGFIFFNRFNEIYIPEGVNRELHRMINSYNKSEKTKSEMEGRDPELMPHFSTHYIRHTFCSRLCEADMNIKAIQAVMGHRDIQTTLDIYAEVSENKKRESLEKVFKDLHIF